ncbi:recombinase family protein [Nitratireductor kimnyeongensis]|uniref:Recombinase family protein n=1 Tax=Nitratireductor kimnyeongensis TaxID=430679 RepID=A0ABW0TB52_9HYPH|nr:recombinase family protein [Nitratireductor kimnyeongensis]QZZ37129.1 recombinase family protein [Nitratireductor kimnyeongensis]
MKNTKNFAPKAYSYVRFSTPEQARGDSKRRQIEKATEYAARHGLDLVDDEYMDLGVSAYRGRNREEGALADFLLAVKDGVIERGSYLLVESMDRISREKPRKAVRLLEDICEAGIVLVTLADGKAYSIDTLDNDPMAFMWAFMVATRANEESEIKSQRVREAWRRKRQRASEEGAALTARVPAWLRLSEDGRSFIPIEDRVEVIKRIFAAADRGEGQHTIAASLNGQGVDTFGNGKRKAAFWHRSYIAKILRNTAVIGTLTPHTSRETGGKRTRDALEPIPNYYPKIIPTALFERVNSRRRGGNTPRMRGEQGQVSNILAGLAKCPKCGSTMTRVNKGRSGGTPSLVCTSAKAGAGCTYHAVKLSLVESAIRRAGNTQFVFEVPSGDPLIDERLNMLNREFDGVGAAINNLLEEIEEGGSSPALRRRLEELEATQMQLQDELSNLEEQASKTSGKAVDRVVGKLQKALTNQKNSITEMNTALRDAMMNCVVDYRVGCLVFHWKHSQETTEVPFDFPLE